MKNHPDTKISPLFEGGKSYVHSVTTLATLTTVQHFADGSLLLPFVKDLLITAASFGETIIYHYMILIGSMGYKEECWRVLFPI